MVQESSYPEKIPMYLLLGEVCETVQNDGFETVLPSIVAEVAAQTVAIIADPSHKMYGKVNKFLNRAPSWDAQKVISYWTDRILLKEPEDDDGHDLEINWLLQLLINGLRNAKVSIRL
jgi:nucleolar pre-ribosomal-associated protein 1